jgi:hypothetical protein
MKRYKSFFKENIDKSEINNFLKNYLSKKFSYDIMNFKKETDNSIIFEGTLEDARGTKIEKLEFEVFEDNITWKIDGKIIKPGLTKINGSNWFKKFRED